MGEILFADMSSRLSIICPTYNRASFLEECVAPIFARREIEVEFLIVDDCSTDLTCEVVARLQAAHGAETIRFFRLEKNSGAQVARNRGIAAAQGDFMMFVDSDDVVVPDGVLQVLRHLQFKPELDYAYGKVQMADEALRPLLGKAPVGSAFENVPVEVAGYHWHTMGPIYRRRCIEKAGHWNLELTGSQDWEYQARVKLFGGQGEFVDALVGYWRQHTGGRVGTRSFRPDYVRSVMKACKSIHTHAIQAGKCDSALERRLAKKLIVHAIEWGANGYRKDKALCLKQAKTTASGHSLIGVAASLLAFWPSFIEKIILKKFYGL
jgi:glycosyltransferase involved in cell wall biosynthesis